MDTFGGFDADRLEIALRAVGQLLASEGERVAIVVVGGAALKLLGVVQRATSDVDVIARVTHDDGGQLRLERATPFPSALEGAIRTVARDFGLPETWLNAVVEAQWKQGLPPGILDDIAWKRYGGGLDVGLVGRRTVIALKLFAAADAGPQSVHVQDLLALRPTPEELAFAAEWVRSQDAAPEWNRFVDQVIDHVERHDQ